MNKKDKIKQDLKDIIEKSNSSQNIADYIGEIKLMINRYEILFSDIKVHCRIIENSGIKGSIDYLKHFFDVILKYKRLSLWAKHLDLMFKYEIEALYNNIKDNEDRRLILEFENWVEEKKEEIAGGTYNA